MSENQTVFAAIETVKAAVKETRESFARYSIYTTVSADHVLRGLEELCDALLTGGDVDKLLRDYGVGVVADLDPQTPAEADADADEDE